MANRRMFSLKVCDTDAFLEMPPSSQLLYFHLALRADDDGFIANPKRIMRMVGSTDDDLRILLMKRFILTFESGVCVVKHWLIHNNVRKDRYTPTQYVKEMQMLVIDDETKKYSLNSGFIEDKKNVIPDGNQMEPQVRLGKVRLGKDNKTSLSFLKNVPDDVAKELSEKYKISQVGIKKKAYDLFLYCESKGRKYKNYKATLENAIRKDQNTLKNEFPLRLGPVMPVEKKQLTTEQIERNKAMMKDIASIAKGKKVEHEQKEI